MVNVTLKWHTPNPAQVIAEAVRRTYPTGLDSLLDHNATDEEIIACMFYNGYWSPLEHVFFAFELTMTKTLAPELLEHRISQHTGSSSRGWGGEPVIADAPNHWTREQQALYQVATGRAWEIFQELRKDGLEIDEARRVLPLGLECNYYWTANCNSLINLFGLRLCPRAWSDFRILAEKMYLICLEKFPALFKRVGCRGINNGVCPENEFRKAVTECPYKDPSKDNFIPTKKDISIIFTDPVAQDLKLYLKQWKSNAVWAHHEDHRPAWKNLVEKSVEWYECKSCGSIMLTTDYHYKERDMYESLKAHSICENCARSEGGV